MKGIEERDRDKGLTVLWIGFQDKEIRIREFAEKHNLARVGYDAGDKTSKLFGISYGAGLVFINREGIVKSRIPRGMSQAALEAGLKKIL